jgi:hypothetical protein
MDVIAATACSLGCVRPALCPDTFLADCPRPFSTPSTSKFTTTMHSLDGLPALSPLSSWALPLSPPHSVPRSRISHCSPQVPCTIVCLILRTGQQLRVSHSLIVLSLMWSFAHDEEGDEEGDDEVCTPSSSSLV